MCRRRERTCAWSTHSFWPGRSPPTASRRTNHGGSEEHGMCATHAASLNRRGEDDWTHVRSEEHTSELQSLTNLVCRLLLEKKKKKKRNIYNKKGRQHY